MTKNQQYINYFLARRRRSVGSVIPVSYTHLIGAMTDFSALISNPKLMLIGAAAQFGIFGAYMIALAMGFDPMPVSYTHLFKS